MTLSEDNTILYDAIDDYSILTANQKKLLKTLINIAVDGEVVASINDLSRLTNTMRATVSTGLTMLEKIGVIEISKVTGIRFSSCTLKQSKLNEIIAHFQNKKQLLQK